MHGRSGSYTAGRKLASALMASALLVGVLAPGAAASGVAPTLGRDSLTVLEDTGATPVGVLANDTDPEPLDTLTVTACNIFASNGTLSISANDCDYTPLANFFGTFTASYSATDGTSTRSASIDITVTAINDVPSFTKGANQTVAEDAGPQSVSNWATSLNRGGGSYESAQVLNFIVTVPEANQALFSTQPAISPTGTLTYTPAADASGAATVNVAIHDNGGTANGGVDTSATQQFSITVNAVNDPVVAVDDSVTVDEDVATDLTTLTANDTDADHDELGIDRIAAPASHGVAVTKDIATVTYTPAENYCGPDSFDYVVSDGESEDTATVTVTVDCLNDAPNAVDDGPLPGTEDVELVIPVADLLANDSDVETAHGDLEITNVVSSDGTVAIVGTNVEFTGNQDVCGLVDFAYTLSDSANPAGTATATVEIDLDCANDAPVPGTVDFDLDEDTPETFSIATDIVGPATDPDDGDTISFASAEDGAHGTVVVSGDDLTYTPDQDYCGADSFDYAIEDLVGGPVTGTAVVHIACVNDDPVVVNESVTFPQGAVEHRIAVIGNDSDVDGDTLSLQSVAFHGGPIVGAGTVAKDGNVVVYTPDWRDSGAVLIDYVISDGHGGTTDGLLTVNLTPDATDPTLSVPTVTFGTGRVNESAPVKVSWTGSDAGVGLKSYKVEVKVGTAAYKQVYLGLNTSTTTGIAFGKAFTFRVTATDQANNDVAKTSASRTVAVYQVPVTSAVKYGKTAWKKVSTTSASGTGYAYNTHKGDWAKVTFTGYEVLYVARTSSSGSSSVQVWIGTSKLGTYSLRGASAYGKIVARKTWSSKASHTIKIYNNKAGQRITLDAFIVLK